MLLWNEKQIELLNQSITKYISIINNLEELIGQPIKTLDHSYSYSVNGYKYNIGAIGCPLCKHYNIHNVDVNSCLQCPIYLKNDAYNGCRNTPWYNIDKEKTFVSKEYISSIQAELDFLKEVLVYGLGKKENDPWVNLIGDRDYSIPKQYSIREEKDITLKEKQLKGLLESITKVKVDYANVILSSRSVLIKTFSNIKQPVIFTDKTVTILNKLGDDCDVGAIHLKDVKFKYDNDNKIMLITGTRFRLYYSQMHTIYYTPPFIVPHEVSKEQLSLIEYKESDLTIKHSWFKKDQYYLNSCCYLYKDSDEPFTLETNLPYVIMS
jgi:hypothetical protein